MAANQLAALQMMGQASAAANSVEDQLEMEREKDPAATAPWYTLACCGGAEVVGELPEKTLEEMAAEASAARYERLTLRLNVFSGSNIPASYSTYLGIEITDVNHTHEDFSVSDEGPSRTPTWGQSFELPLTFNAGMALEMKITVWGRSLVHGNFDRQLGDCIVRLPSRQTEWPVMHDAPLLHVPVLSAFGEPEPAKVRLVYELLQGHASPQKALEGASDLLQVASIGDAGSIETSWFIKCALFKLKLQDLPAAERVSHQVILRIVKRQRRWAHSRREVAGKPKRTGDITKMTTETGQLDAVLSSTDGENTQFDSAWSLVARRAHLGGYCLEVIVREVEEEERGGSAGSGGQGNQAKSNAARAVVVGHWEETLANLMGYIAEEGCKVRLRAQLAKVNSNMVAGELELEVDIWDLVEHRKPPEMTVPRLRMGRRPTQAEPRWVYFVLWLDRFAPSSSQESYPFLRLTIGKNVQIANATSQDPSSEKVMFEPVGILMHASVMRLRIEVLNRVPSITGGSPVEEFIGEVMIRDIVPREVYWRHIFAGSPMGHSLEESNLMGKDVKRASTYRCSVGIWMQGTPTVKDDFHLQTFGGAYRSAHLVVRLYQGLYLERFKSTSVKIVVAVGGCDNSTGTPSRTIFTFPGKVDANGSLYFYGDARKLNVSKTEYVEQSTNVPLMLPPRVFHAYLYMYRDGADETREAPEVWGRVRVAPSFKDNKWNPHWKTMRVDTSASDLAPSDFDCNFAGTILAQAALIEGVQMEDSSPRSQEDSSLHEVVEADVIDFVKGSGWCTATPALKHVPKVAIKTRDDKSQQRMFCHLDLLVARKVLPMHDVADHKILFELQVCEQVKTIDGIQQSPSPSLMHRHEIEMDSWNLVGLPVPPIVIQVKKVPVSGSMFKAGGKLVCRLGVKTKDLDNATGAQEGIAPGQIDLNLAHKALWHSLDGRFKQDFNPTDCGGVSPFWKGRPRLLLAVGFSEKRAAANTIGKGLDTGSIPKILTPKTQKYHIELSVLGLRDLKDQDEEAFLNPNCYVQVESWWDDANESCRLELTNQGLNPELPNPSFRTSNYSGKHRATEGKIINMYEHMLGSRHLADALRLKDHVKAADKTINLSTLHHDLEVGDDIMIQGEVDRVAKTIKAIRGAKITLSKKLGKPFESDSTVTKLGQADALFLGHRMLLPTYECPVVPYLQAQGDEKDKNGGTGMVLLPDLLFKLMQRDQLGLYGPLVKAAVSVPLPLRSLEPKDMDPPKWSESAAARFSEEKMVAKIDDPEMESFEDPVFDMFVDVFACRSGWLKFDDDFRMGRPLATSTMFSIWENDPADQGALSEAAKKEQVDKRKVQRFNPADKGLDVKDTRQYGTPYNRNFVPTFRNAKWTGSVDTPGSERGWIDCPMTKLAENASKDSKEVIVEKLEEAWDVAAGTRILIGDSPTPYTIAKVAKTLALEEKLDRGFDAGTKVKILTRGDKCKPLEPATLYRSVVGMRGLSQQHVEELPLRDLKAVCADRGFRMCTRLAAPDPVVPFQSESKLQSLEECNSHTFVRKVGHVVKPAERQSTILARLRMGLPVKAASLSRREAKHRNKMQSQSTLGLNMFGVAEDEKDARDARVEEQQNNCCNFLVVKCLKPAVVIWAPSEETTHFPFPGTLLFVVQLLNSDSEDVVEVRVPSVDRRFIHETAWYLGKTLVKGAMETKRRLCIGPTPGETNLIPDVGDSDDDADESHAPEDDDDDLEDARGTSGGYSGSVLPSLLRAGRGALDGPGSVDGYSQAVPISKWAFVCRLRKRGNVIFHRRQTYNYFTAIMDQYFQEYSPMPLDPGLDEEEGVKPYKPLDDPQEDLDKMRMCVLEKTLNLRRPLEAVGDDGVAGMIKGHIAIRQHNDNAEESESDDDEWTIVANAGLSGIELEGSGEIYSLTDAMKHADIVGAAAFTQEEDQPDRRHSTCSTGTGLLPPPDPEELDQRAKYYFHPTKDAAPRDAEGRQMNLFRRTNANPDRAFTFGSPNKSSGQAQRKNSGMMAKMMAKAVPPVPPLLPATCPVNNMWVAKDVRVVISVFSIAHLIPVDYEIRPYITVHLMRPGGEEETRRIDTLSPVSPGSDCIDVYWQTDVVTELPGTSNLIIRVWHKAGVLGTSRDTELGSVTLDLEDRQLALVQREFRVNTSEPRLRKLISPARGVTIERPSPQDPGFDMTFKSISKKKVKVHTSKGLKMSINPRRAPAAPAPIEYRQMTLPQPGCVEEPTGMLRFCTEFLDARAAFRPAVLSPTYKKIHVSLYINEVKNICVYRDSGERNDAKVVGELQMRDKNGQALPMQTRSTDIHKWAHNIAKFEYYWHFLIDYPLGAASLKLRLFDVDTFSADSEIYHPMTLSMDFMLKTFFEKLLAAPVTSTNESMSFVEEVVFDAWPADYPEHAKMWYKGCLHYWCSRICYFIMRYLCCRDVHPDVPQPKPATLRLRIDMVHVSDSFVLETPEVGPAEVPEGRVNWKTGISNPKDTCLAILGRPNANLLKWACRSVCCILCTAVSLAILYFVVMFLANLQQAG